MDYIVKRIILLFIVATFFSCKDEYTICDQDLTVAEKSGFYHISGGVEQVGFVPLFTLTALGSTTDIYSRAQNLSKFSLPLNPLVDSAKFRLSVGDNYTDTVTFIYSNRSMTVSANCGIIYIHTLSFVKTTHHKLDSVRISNRIIDNVSGENLKIYF